MYMHEQGKVCFPCYGTFNYLQTHPFSRPTRLLEVFIKHHCHMTNAEGQIFQVHFPSMDFLPQLLTSNKRQGPPPSGGGTIEQRGAALDTCHASD